MLTVGIIYIPLCFYFIGAALGKGAAAVPFTFHYASTLSKACGRAGTWKSWFTFHYASTLSLQPGWDGAGWSGFTFHYASTLSNKYYNRKKSGILFTFHYASTLSCLQGLCRANQHHLHSTMLLLYRWKTPIIRMCTVIYIPLCFYFIDVGQC